MLKTPEGKDWANAPGTESDHFRMGALKKWSYSPSMFETRFPVLNIPQGLINIAIKNTVVAERDNR